MSRIVPILFNTDMVRAILDGRKTVTRRVVKPQPEKDMKYKLVYCVDGDKGDIEKFGFGSHECGGHVLYVKPPALVGDILYVRETWCWCPCWDCGMDLEEGCCDKTANKFYNHEKGEMGCYGYKASFEDNEQPFDKWYPSIHMPKEAARIWLKVTNIRVERLQDITESGARAEGFEDDIEYALGHPAVYYFLKLWNQTINKKDINLYSWGANPWVWVIEFERCEKPKEG